MLKTQICVTRPLLCVNYLKTEDFLGQRRKKRISVYDALPDPQNVRADVPRTAELIDYCISHVLSASRFRNDEEAGKEFC